MADQNKAPGAPERVTQQGPQMAPLTVQLKELPNPAELENLDDYCHREKVKLSDAYLAGVAESLRQERQLEPVQIAWGAHEAWLLLTGHRRVAAMYLLAKKGVEGFSPEMEVVALEVVGASMQDLLIRSVADNEVREKLDVKERLLVIQKLDRAGVPKERGAAALGIGVKTYERDLRVATHPRMVRHVLEDNVGPSAASWILYPAEKHRRTDEFLEFFNGWVERKKAEIADLDRLSKAESGKGLRPTDLLVKNHVTPQLVDTWLEALERDAPFTDAPGFNFEATIDKKSGRLRVERLSVDTQEASVLDLVKVGSKLTQLGKRVLAVAQRRHELQKLEDPQKPNAALATPSPYDKDVLREFGLEEVAEQLESEVRAGQEEAAEGAPEEGAEEGPEEPAGE
jgi:hypothetical protein